MNKTVPNRNPVSSVLDKLYNKTIRCPYCGTKIPKYTAVCENCGLTKAQIAEGKVSAAGKTEVLYTNIRPSSISFWKMAISAVFGFTGIHCFISRRWIRGTIIAALCFGFLICAFIFNPAYIDSAGNEIAAHPLRYAFTGSEYYFFPTDVCGLVGVCLWIWDWIAIVFGWYKYPVRISSDKNAAAVK
jgi:TM2 domain-containing membrane protein YozV